VNDEGIWEERYRSMVDLERLLYRTGTRVIKFFLHLSKAERRERFIKRIDDPEKNWKFSSGDIAVCPRPISGANITVPLT